MTTVSLPTEAERLAAEASNLPEFVWVNLPHIRSNVIELLSLIRTSGLFEEYTLHDFSHCEAMLNSLSWLVTAKAKDNLSPVDWLMLVLGIYFHDLGLLISHDEFSRRDDSGFIKYSEERKRLLEQSREYSSWMSRLGHYDLELFLYQEFVRHNHAE